MDVAFSARVELPEIAVPMPPLLMTVETEERE